MGSGKCDGRRYIDHHRRIRRRRRPVKVLKTRGIRAFLRGLAVDLLKKQPSSKSDEIWWQISPHSIVPRSFSAVLLAICVILSEVMMYDDLPRVYAALDCSMTVTMDADIPLSFNETLNAFTGSQLLSESCDNERAHRIVNVNLPDEYEMNTPEGVKPAPEGTEVIFSGQMSARRGYHNSQSSDPYSSTIKVKVPLSEDFKEYGPGEYSLIIPVELTMEEAYGSYTEEYAFTPWETLIEKGTVRVEGSTLTDISGRSDVLEIDPSITELKNNFAYMVTYREVDIPETVTSAYEAFYGSGIKELYFESNTIPEGICKDMYALQKVVLAEGVTTFGDYVFKGCSALSDFTFPHTMTTLGVSSFENCEGLKELTIRSNLETTNYSAMGSPLSYSGIERVIVEDGVTEIPARIYCNATELKELILPASLEKIGAQAFIGCSQLQELTIRSNITTGSTLSPFNGNGIKNLTFAEGVTSIPSYFFDKSISTIESLYLPSTLSSIGYNAFRGTGNMTVYYAGTEEEWSKVSKSTFKPTNVVYGAEPPLNLMSAFMLSSAMPSAEELMALEEDDESMSMITMDDEDTLETEIIEGYPEESLAVEETGETDAETVVDETSEEEQPAEDSNNSEEQPEDTDALEEATEEPEEGSTVEDSEVPEEQEEDAIQPPVIPSEGEESSSKNPDNLTEDYSDQLASNEDPSSPSGDGSFGMTVGEPGDSQEPTGEPQGEPTDLQGEPADPAQMTGNPQEPPDAPLETPFEPDDPEEPLDPEEEDWVEDDPSLPLKDPEEDLIEEPITVGP